MEQLQAALVQSRSQNSALGSELAMRKKMYAELLKGKQISDDTVTEAQRDLQAMNARVSQMDIELRVCGPPGLHFSSYSTRAD